MARRKSTATGVHDEKLRTFIVSVTRVSTYEVQAHSEDHALDVYTEEDPEEVDGETLSMTATEEKIDDSNTEDEQYERQSDR